MMQQLRGLKKGLAHHSEKLGRSGTSIGVESGVEMMFNLVLEGFIDLAEVAAPALRA
jgi:hypothetical protein